MTKLQSVGHQKDLADVGIPTIDIYQHRDTLDFPQSPQADFVSLAAI